jgi:hypothetical protein
MGTTIVRVTLVLGGTAAYLGLAILGWGGWTAFFAHPALVALAAALAILAGVSLFADGNLSPGVREDRGNRWVIGVLTLIGLPPRPMRISQRKKKLMFPHVLRHAFLRKLAETKGVQYAKEASGHQSDRYIWRYVKPDQQTLADAIDELE